MLEHARAVAFAIAGAGTPYSGPFFGAGGGLARLDIVSQLGIVD